jgi:transcriptional regulator with XRE-family HTH domain
MNQPRPPTPAESKALRAIGERIGELRRAKGMTQAELAEAVGVSLPRIRKIETQIFNLTSLVLLRVAKALDVEPGELLITAGRRARRLKGPRHNGRS